MKKPLQHCRPIPCYTDLDGVYLMDDFGNAIYVNPHSPVMEQWAQDLVNRCTVEH